LSDTKRGGATLLEKISGPNAVPLATLIQKGAHAAQKVHESFGDFLNQRVMDLARLRRELGGRETGVWREFYVAVIDLRGSAATAGRDAAAAVCASLDRMMCQAEWDAKAVGVLNSHIDALILMTSEHAPGTREIALLVEELEQAASRLAPRAAS
jgi:hypothetical protein